MERKTKIKQKILVASRQKTLLQTENHDITERHAFDTEDAKNESILRPKIKKKPKKGEKIGFDSFSLNTEHALAIMAINSTQGLPIRII